MAVEVLSTAVMREAGASYGSLRVPPVSRRLLILLAAAAPIVFALATNNIWEDFFITFRCSMNLVEGNGLVFEAGRRLHTFTSPLGTLIPAGISAALHSGDPQQVVDVFRLLASACLAVAWVVASRHVQRPASMATLAVLWLLDPKLAAYSTNGMETAFVVVFTILAWHATIERKSVLAGIALGGALWTRPDGFVFAGSVMAGAWLFPAAERPPLSWWIRAAAIAALLYAPWFIWSWWYYGSPVPQTVIAKGAYLRPLPMIEQLVIYPFRFVFTGNPAVDAFLPPYFFFGGWPSWIWLWGKLLSLAAAAAVFHPRVNRPARAAGVGFLIGGLYMTMTVRSPWYFPPWEVLAYIAVAGLVDALLGASTLRRTRLIVQGAVVAVGLAQAVQFVAISTELREQQRIIEWGLRRRIGGDLRRIAKRPTDTVFLEPLGYIGFYSGLAMRDTPGLCSPEVARLRKNGVTAMADIIGALKPDWAVLRLGEFRSFTRDERAAFERRYDLWCFYDVRPEVEAVRWLPGRNFLLFDAAFSVWRRREPGGP